MKLRKINLFFAFSLIYACFLYDAFADIPVMPEEGDSYEDCIGLSKAELYMKLPLSDRKHYHKEGNEEWILFRDRKSDEPGAEVIFYLKDDKIEKWAKQVIPETPEQRLEIIEKRKQFATGSSSFIPYRNDERDIQKKEELKVQRMKDTLQKQYFKLKY